MKKVFVLSVIALFIGVGFQPAFANDNNISVSRAEQQPRGVTFYKTFGGLFSDSGNYVQQTTDGGYIIIGTTEYLGYSYIWLIKTDSTGNMLWDKIFSGAENGEAVGFCVQQTIDGGYIITGHIRHPIQGGYGVWLIKTNSTGNMLWENIIGEMAHYFNMYIQQTNDGGYILTGCCAIFTDHRKFHLIKVDSAGNMEWDKIFYRTGWESGNCVQQTTDGGYIIVGNTGYKSDIWLIKTNSTGNMEWDKTFGGAKTDWGTSVKQTTDGGYIITGKTDDDVWLIKTNITGDMEWEKTFGGIFYNCGNSVQQTTDGGYIITGDVWLIKTNSTGNKLWENTFRGTSGNCVQQTTDGGYIIVGDTRSFITDFDVLLIKTNEYGKSKNKAVTGNMLLLKILDRFPLLERFINFVL